MTLSIFNVPVPPEEAMLNAELPDIVEVKPNGNMVLEGERNVLANHETQILKVRGMIRPDDVGPDNSVQSTYLADAKIEYTGKGALGERQKPGILSRIFRQLF